MLLGMTILLSEQKITSPLGTQGRNTTATLRQGCPNGHCTINFSQVKKENNSKKRNLPQSKAEKEWGCGFFVVVVTVMAFTLFVTSMEDSCRIKTGWNKEV